MKRIGRLTSIWHTTLAKNMKLTKYLHENNLMFPDDKEQHIWYICYYESPMEIFKYFQKNIGTLKSPLALNECIIPIEYNTIDKFKYVIQNDLYHINGPIDNIYFEIPEFGCIIFEYIYTFDESILRNLTINYDYLLEYKNKRRAEVCTKGPIF